MRRVPINPPRSIEIGAMASSTVSPTPAPLLPISYNWGAVCWGDYDQDGFLDLFMADGWSDGSLGQSNALYHGSGDGTFTRIKEGPLVTTRFSNLQGGGLTDLDDDGDLDVVLADFTTGPEVFRNDGGGNFVRVTQGALRAGYRNRNYALVW